MNNYGNNQNNSYNYNIPSEVVNGMPPYTKKKSNTALIALVSGMIVLILILSSVVILMATGIIGPSDESVSSKDDKQKIVIKNDETDEEETKDDEIQSEVVDNDKNSPEEDSVPQQPVHDERHGMYPIESTPVEDNTWDYDPYEVTSFVESSVMAYVTGINNSDSSYVDAYYTGQIAAQEKKSFATNLSVAQSEEILSLNCHSVSRVSADKVTVVRDSVIRVYYKNSDVKDVTERLIYTVQYINGRMYIVNLTRG